MPTLKEYNVKLTRLRSTRKLTRTMKLVSVNKLRRAQDAEKRVADFTGRIHDMIGRLASLQDTTDGHSLLNPHRTSRNILLLVITSDRGLCGGFNNNLLRETSNWIAGRQKISTIRISCCGRKAHSFLKNRFTVERYYEHAVARPDFAAARQISHELASGFLSGRLDEIHVAWNKTGAPSIERLIPMDPSLIPSGGDSSSQAWQVEPDKAALLEAAVPNLVTLQLYQALLSSAAGEHSARMRAMEQATSNADNLIRKLTLQRNRARQAQITTELTEIVAGAEALR
jgi:F-type H+-transporting ATPase subunit gamma